MDEWARALLLTPRGRRVLLAAYVAGAVVSIATYAIVRSAGYAVAQAVLFAIGAAWTLFCLHRA
jgi:hypothetical protein